MRRDRDVVPRRVVVASLVTLVLTVLASGVGLFAPGVYDDAAAILPQLYGQDLLTLLVAVPALALSLRFAVRGSLRGYVLWLGVTGYLLYTYATYAFMTAFNELYLVYVALLGLTFYTFIAGLLDVDAPALETRLRERSVRPYVAFQLAAAALVAGLWLSDIVTATLSGTTPAVLAGTGLPAPVIQSLDLAILVPALLIAAHWLRARRAWGYVLTGVLLVKLATLGLAVLSMAALQLRAGHSVPPPMLASFGAVSLGALGLLARFTRSISPLRDRTGSSVASDLPGGPD